jgi:2-keto-4-pentenoate hydratase/2-oxohepta-3-ene-1,7-dioic acid hydratase in catechol pathway
MIVTRVEHKGDRYLARIVGDTAVLLAKEDSHTAADAFRDALASGLDVSRPGQDIGLSEVRLLAPTRRPGKLLAVGNNYLAHARESGSDAPAAPIIFAKATSSVIGPGEAITFSTHQSTQVDYEGELAVVMGGTTRQVAPEQAVQNIFGYTVCNDVSARDAQFGDGQWVRGKSFDTFAPLGPWVVTAESIPAPQALAIRTRVNGGLLQDGNTSLMIFSVAEIVAYISTYITLEPGDVVATGTPAGVGFARVPPIFLGDGDMVEVEVEGIGVLRNPVAFGPSGDRAEASQPMSLRRSA